MADKKISDFTAVTALASGDLIEIETVAGNSRKITAANAGLFGATSFPGSPATGQRIWRTDRNIEYFYDGTRWLSTQLHTLEFQQTDGTMPTSATAFHRARNPWSGIYDVYIETFTLTSYITTTTASNYFVGQVSSLNGAASTNIGSTVSTQSNTQNVWETDSLTVNAVAGSTEDYFQCTLTETGTCAGYLLPGLNYRLVG